MEIEFVPEELASRAKKLGFPIVSWLKDSVTIEDLERWIWKKHQKLFPSVVWEPVHKHYLVFIRRDEYVGLGKDPFAARLTGVTGVIDKLERTHRVRKRNVKR